MKSVDTFVIIGANTTSVTLFVTPGVDLVVLEFSAVVSCASSLGNKVIHSRMMMNKNIMSKTKYEKDQHFVESFGYLYRKSLHDNLIDRKE